MISFRLAIVTLTVATLLSSRAVRADDGENIPTLDKVVAHADSVETLYVMLPSLFVVTTPPLDLEQIDPIGSEQSDCEKLQGMSFILGCSVSGVLERDTLRNKNSYAAGSSMYRLLEYQERVDTGLFAASEIGSALNKFELEWSQGADLHRISKEFLGAMVGICNSQFAGEAPQSNVNECIRASGQFLAEMAEYINPQTRNTWVDQVLADTMQVRPTWSGVNFTFSYLGVSSSFGFESVPSAILDYKKNLFRDWTCKRVRQEREEAGCPIA